MTTVYFLVPDARVPKGGVRRLYLWADLLNRQGIHAAIVHLRARFRCEWFESSTPVVTAAELRLRPSDILAVPEVFGPLITRIAPGIPKVIVNQNAYRSLSKFGANMVRDENPYLHPDIAAVIVVSQDSERYLSYVFPELAVHRIHCGVDLSLYQPPDIAPGHRISYMPRKRRADSEEILKILWFRGTLDGWDVVPIDRRSEADAARQIRESAIFLSFSEREGFGLPPAEAMACGSIVVGFHGQGGSEFFDPDHCFPVTDADVLGFAQTLERVLTTFDEQRGLYTAMGKRAAAFIRSNYSPQREEADLLAVFGPLVERCGAGGPDVTIDRRLLEPRVDALREVAHHLVQAITATKLVVGRR